MGCYLVVFALFTPRLVVALLWFLSTWFTGMFTTIVWPILGFIFLPTTLLWYSAVQHWFGGEWTLVPIAGIIVAVLIDVAPAGGARRRAE